MPRPASKATIIVSDGNLQFTQAGVYTIDYLPSGNVQIKLDGGKATVLKPGDYAGITSFSFAPGATLGSQIRVDGITFAEAGPDGAFEINKNLDDLLGTLISTQGIEWTVANLIVNGSQADTLKVLWDYLDDAYVVGNNYYNLPLNENFVRLGVEYVEYLEAGGEPLTFVTAKYSADNGDVGTIPQREQSMHDNLLGNLTLAAIQDRFSDPLESELLALIPDEYQDRPYFDGFEQRLGTAAHDGVRAFDYDKGWDRPDYEDHFFGKVDPLASSDRNNDGVDEQMLYGTGNSNDNFNIVRDEGVGVELALKAKQFGPNGGDYGSESFSFDEDGVLHYHVSTGPSADNANRADWSIDYAATVLQQGLDENITFKLFIDTDETEGVNLVEIPMTTYGGLQQGSTNYAFFRNGIDIDDEAAGVQPYAFGPGEFDIVLQAYAGDDLVAVNQIVVHVDFI